MIFCNKTFKLKVVPNSGTATYTRFATCDSNVEELGKDDILYMSKDAKVSAFGVGEENRLVIDSFQQVKRVFRTKRLACVIIALICWVAVIFSALIAASDIADGDTYFKAFLPVALTACAAAIFTPQIFNPVAHDDSGHWINLKTGFTNLNDGCFLRKVKK